MKRLAFLMLALMALIFSCELFEDKPDNDDDWPIEDQEFYHNVLTLQDEAFENYQNWLLTMDSLEAINQLQQFFLNDASVTSATVGSQGIAVQYSNGMRGGIFLDPEFGPLEDSLKMDPFPKSETVVSGVRSLVNPQKAILIFPIYYEMQWLADNIEKLYKDYLPKVGMDLEYSKNLSGVVDDFAKLSGHGIIHLCTHGYAWPYNEFVVDVYARTSEEASDQTTRRYWNDVKSGEVIIMTAEVFDPTFIGGWDWIDVYFLSEKFITAHNDFSKDTVLFFGTFCYSHLGDWPQIVNTCASGTYFGVSWWFWNGWADQWSFDLISRLCDTSTVFPITPEQWMNDPTIQRSYWEPKDNISVYIQFTGDPALTLWKGTTWIQTYSIIDITQNSATCGGDIKSDGGSPITARGVCFNLTGNPTLSDNHTTDGNGTGEFESQLTGLLADTVYYVRAYATNSTGTSYGNQVSFRTLPAFYLGQRYGGGVILILDNTNQHGLIAAETDQITGPPWGTGASWGCMGTEIGGLSQEYGKGQVNTNLILMGCGESGIAARICDDLVLNGYDDWFLPSFKELEMMCQAHGLPGCDILTSSTSYWSSSESFQNDALRLDTPNCAGFFELKATLLSVRAVRYF